MGVYIKGAALPLNCFDCPFEHLQECHVHTSIGASGYKDKRYEHCPLVEIKPDRRLIDAEMMIDDIFYLWKNSGISNYDWILLRQIVNAQPTIIEAEGAGT